MDRWKSRCGKSQRREEKRKEEKRREEERRSEKRKSQKKEEAGARKGRKVAKHSVFPMFWGSEGSKSRLAKAAGRRWEMKICTPLWREAHFQAKMLKTSKNTFQRLGTLGSCDVEKCTPLWREARFRVKMCKTPQRRSTFGSWDVQKVLWREAHFEVKSVTNWLSRTISDHFWTFRCRFVWQAQKGFCTFCRSCNNVGRREDLRRCMSRGRRSTSDMFVRDVRRSGRWFPERGCILEPHIFRFAEMILRDRCSTSYDLASLFRGRRNILDRWGEIAKRIGASLSAYKSLTSHRLAASKMIYFVFQLCSVCIFKTCLET